MADDNKPDEKPTEKPPWGDEEANFDAARAWTLIQGLRTDKASLSEELATAKADQAAAEKARDDAQAEADTAKKELAGDRREAVLKEFEIDEDDAQEFLSGDMSLDELRRKAERLSKRKAADDPKTDDDPKDDAQDGDDPKDDGDPTDDDEGLPGRPKPKLTPGHGGAPKADLDLDAIANAARRR